MSVWTLGSVRPQAGKVSFNLKIEISGGAWPSSSAAITVKTEPNIEEFEVTPEIGEVFMTESEANIAAEEDFEGFGNNSNYCCNECGLVAGGRRALIRHLRNDHFQEIGLGKREKPRSRTEKGATKQRRRRRRQEQCQNLLHTTHTKTQGLVISRIRRRRMTKRPVEVISDPTEWIGYYTPERVGGKGFACNACDFECLRLADFRRHVAIAHSSNRKLHQEGQETGGSSLLTGLFETGLSGEEILRCQVCCYEANSRSHLTMHMKVHGSGGGGTSDDTTIVFTCEMCGFKASTRSHLTKHKKVHERTSKTEEESDPTGKKKNFSCDICGYRTVSRQSLAVHRHNHAGRRPFACSSCGYRAANRERLAIHALGHTAQGRPFGCPQCPFRTAYRRSLAEHERKHTGERPYACLQCDYKAANRSNLVRHVANIHVAGGGLNRIAGYAAPERPHPCPHCAYRSTNRSNLVRHVTNMHLAKPGINKT